MIATEVSILEQLSFLAVIIGTFITFITFIFSVYSVKKTKILTRTKDLQDVLEILETILFWFSSRYRTNDPIKSKLCNSIDARIVTLNCYKTQNLISKLEKIKFKTIGLEFESDFDKLIKSLYDLENNVGNSPALYTDVKFNNIPEDNRDYIFQIPNDIEKENLLKALNNQVTLLVNLTSKIENTIRKII